MSIELSQSWAVFSALAVNTCVRKDESRTSEAAYKGVYLDSRNTKIDGLKSTDRANERKGGGEEWVM